MKAVNLDIGYGRMAVAARAVVSGVPVIVYGSVLPWNGISESGLLHPGEDYRNAFRRILSEQAADIRRLAVEHPEAIVVWAGDFNQALAPPHYVGSTAHRDLLRESLCRLGLVAWNGANPAAKEESRTIDLICGSAHCDVRSIEHIPDTVEGRRLSDHLGYVVEIQITPEK